MRHSSAMKISEICSEKRKFNKGELFMENHAPTEKKSPLKLLLEKGKVTGKLTSQEIDQALIDMDIDIEEDVFPWSYPEFSLLTGGCRFADCRHINEPDCMVKKGVENGEIFKDRYIRYKEIYKEIKEKQKYDKKY